MQNDAIEPNVVDSQPREYMVHHLHWLAAIHILITSTARDDNNRQVDDSRVDVVIMDLTMPEQKWVRPPENCTRTVPQSQCPGDFRICI
jgi:hypothetical protein